MCKGGKTKNKRPEKTDVKTEDETAINSKEAAKIAKFKEELAARSPPTVYRPDESSERALKKIPEIGSSSSLLKSS